MDSTNIFPLPFTAHIIFVAVAFIFFMIQFIRVRYKYQIIMAVAASFTMLVYVKDTKTWFYAVGILEFGLLLLALVAAIAEKHSRKVAAKADAEKVDTVGENIQKAADTVGETGTEE